MNHGKDLTGAILDDDALQNQKGYQKILPSQKRCQ
jgi:hypothetical protein